MAEACTTATTFTQKRTLDVKIKEDVDFESLLLSDEILFGLKKCGFQKPSPVQLKAIPLGRCGLDLIVQAKSGTGKTCVFSVIALESIFLNASGIQVLVLAPTREIAVQIWQVIHSIGAAMPKLRCYTFIGGMPLSEDKVKLKKCHIAVGTPGRVKQLIEEQILNTESVRLFVLDEADKLMEHGFQETINWIFSSLPENKQMLALSATYPEVLAKHLTVYMRNPTFVRLNTDDLSLIGIRQYYKTVQFSPLQQKAFEIKCKVLLELLNAISFQQCLVFSNYQLRAQSLSDILNKEGWPATFISGSQDQQDRLTAMAKLKMFRCRVLISTDLISRGIDAQNVNLIINMDIPHDHETYLHRIGRAGRYGTYGAAITLVSLGKEMADLKTIEAKANTKIVRLPDPVPAELAQASGFMDYSDHITVQTMENSHYKPGKVLDNVCDLNSAKSSTADEELSSLSPAMGKDEQKGYVKDTVANYQENPQQDCIEVVDSISELHDLSKTPLEQENGNHFKMVDDYSTEDGTNPTAYCEENKSKKQNVSIGTESEQSDQDLHCENAMNRTENQQEDRIISTFTRSSSHYLKLPNPQLLHKFSNHLKSNNFCVQDFTLPTLIEVIGHKSKTNSSYSNMVADYECFRKGETPDTSEKCNHDFYESQVYDTALKKVNACMKNLFHGRFCHDLPFTDNSSNIICAQQGHSFTSEKALEVVHGAVEHNSQILYTASKAGDDFLNDLPSNTSVTDDGEKIISFSELNSYFNKADDHKITSCHFAKKKKKSEQVKSQFDGSGHTVEDQKLGLDLMRKLQAQCETDSDSSWFDSQSDVNAYSEVPSSEDGEEYVSDCDKHQIMQEHMHRYSYPPTYEQNTGIYGDQSPFNPWYYPQDSMNPAQLPQGCATSACYMGNGYSMGAPIYGGIFPHQLWMQCANLLGSVNAMQAAHYSWYCQMWHTYHMQCAQAYTSYYNKFRSRFEGHKHDKL